MENFWKKHQIHAVLLGILTTIAAIGWSVGYYQERTDTNTQQEQVTMEKSEKELPQPEKATSTPDSVSPVNNPTVQNSTTDTKTLLTETKPETRQSASSITLRQNSLTQSPISVYDLMVQLSNDGGLEFKTKNYGGNLGFFVTEINGKKNEDEPGKYWFYSVNGKKATVGISNYIVQPNDIITWTYEESEI